MLVLGTSILAKSIINRMYSLVKSIGVYSHHKERINNLMVELNKKVDKVTNKNDFKYYYIIIASSSSCEFSITPDDIGEPIDKMIVFDLAVPRNISPEIASIKNIFSLV